MADDIGGNGVDPAEEAADRIRRGQERRARSRALVPQGTRELTVPPGRELTVQSGRDLIEPGGRNLVSQSGGDLAAQNGRSPTESGSRGLTRAGMPPLNMPSRPPAVGKGLIPDLAIALGTGRQYLHDTYVEPAKRRGREMLENQIRSQGADRDTSDYGLGRGAPGESSTRRPKKDDAARLDSNERLPLPPPAATPPRRRVSARPAPQGESEADRLNAMEIDRIMRNRVSEEEGMMKKGGLVKMAKGGQVKGLKPKTMFKPKMAGGGAVRGCGIASRGKTRGRMV
jgi:hypothetical protein